MWVNEFLKALILLYLGLSQQADLKVVNDAKGQTVYRDHLPLLGEQGPGRTGPHGLQIGDQVCILLIKFTFFISLYDFNF